MSNQDDLDLNVPRWQEILGRVAADCKTLHHVLSQARLTNNLDAAEKELRRFDLRMQVRMKDLKVTYNAPKSGG